MISGGLPAEPEVLELDNVEENLLFYSLGVPTGLWADENAPT
jgi:hypothetical protein